MRNCLASSCPTGSPWRVCTLKKTARLLGRRWAAFTSDTFRLEAQPAASAAATSNGHRLEIVGIPAPSMRKGHRRDDADGGVRQPRSRWALGAARAGKRNPAPVPHPASRFPGAALTCAAMAGAANRAHLLALGRLYFMVSARLTAALVALTVATSLAAPALTLATGALAAAVHARQPATAPLIAAALFVVQRLVGPWQGLGWSRCM